MKANFETGLKICSKCRRELPLDSFYKRERYNDGLDLQCIDCRREKQKEVNKTESHKENQKRYQSSEKGKLQTKRMNQKTLEYKKDWVKRKREEDYIFKLKMDLRTRFNHMISDYHLFKWRSTFTYIGCSIEDFVKYIENQFQEGMSWDNYGSWHIDHILPLDCFNLKEERELFIAWNYRNLQPLWASENCSKSNKVPENVEELINNLRGEIKC